MLFVFAALLAQVQYALFCGFLVSSGYSLVRQVIFLLVVVLGTATAVGTDLSWPFAAICGVVILLPMVEEITGSAYPFFFMASLVFFLLRSVHICLIRRRELYTQISSVSIKEAIDTLHTGLLFFRPSGDILLCNRCMNVLVKQMTGRSLNNGKTFQLLLESGYYNDKSLLDNCTEVKRILISSINTAKQNTEK